MDMALSYVSARIGGQRGRVLARRESRTGSGHVMTGISPTLDYEVVAIFGPTGSGKTDVAEEVARLLDADVVSADAMQVYRGVPILTNQPTRPTRLVAIRELSETMSVGEYERLAHHAIDESVRQRGSVVVAGGTGLYLRAALCNLELPPPPAEGARERLDGLYAQLGAAGAHALLAERDPAAANSVHQNDRRRVVRALELNEQGYSLTPQRDRLWSQEMRRPTLLVGIDLEAGVLAERVAARTTSMFERGAAEEARRADVTSETARHVIGLHEARTLAPEAAIAAIVERTLSYGRYQRKWMRRLPLAITLDGTVSPQANAAEIYEHACTAQRNPASPLTDVPARAPSRSGPVI
jgi:tRNA dimethylallyltransferase